MYVQTCNPNAVASCHLAAMDSAQFTKLDIAGRDGRAGANDRRLAVRLRHYIPGDGRAGGEPLLEIATIVRGPESSPPAVFAPDAAAAKRFLEFFVRGLLTTPYQ
jgi:hypothetical protein